MTLYDQSSTYAVPAPSDYRVHYLVTGEGPFPVHALRQDSARIMSRGTGGSKRRCVVLAREWNGAGAPVSVEKWKESRWAVSEVQISVP